MVSEHVDGHHLSITGRERGSFQVLGIVPESQSPQAVFIEIVLILASSLFCPRLKGKLGNFNKLLCIWGR